MQITITGRHIEITDAIKKYIEEKIGRLEKYYKHIIEAHVIIEKQRERHIAEVNIIASNLKIVAKEESVDMYATIDKLVDNAGSQLKKHREKIKNHKIGTFFKRVFLAGKLDSQESKKNSVIISKYDAAKPKSVDEAIAELELFKTAFLVFKNASTNEINVVHKKGDGKIALLEPEQ